MRNVRVEQQDVALLHHCLDYFHILLRLPQPLEKRRGYLKLLSCAILDPDMWGRMVSYCQVIRAVAPPRRIRGKPVYKLEASILGKCVDKRNPARHDL